MPNSISTKKKTAALEVDKDIIDSILEKLVEEKNKRNDTIVLLKFPRLYKILNKKEEQFINRVLEIDPGIYGFKEPFYGITPVPDDLIALSGQKYTWEKEEKEIATQYLPKHVLDAFSKLNSALEKDIDRKLLIKSGYRSPAYQVFVFIYNLAKKDYDLEEVLRWVALPGYSEHGYPKKQAMDFITEDGIINGEKATFSDTKEYAWLLENGEEFGFRLSYPEGNKEGIAFEPWHWHYFK